MAILAAIAVSPPSDAWSAGDTRPDRIVIAVGEFKPMVFLDASGKVTGMHADLLHLWSKKTGVAVDIRIMDWHKAIPALLTGEVDAVEGVSLTPERANLLDFTNPHGSFSAHIYFHEKLGGVRGLTDLGGFPVGVLAGSNVEEFLGSQASPLLPVPYASYEEMVQTAVDGRIDVFIGEEPMISYLFARSGRRLPFHRTETPLLSSDIRTAVRKGNAPLLALLEEGFSAITPAEKQRIQDAWVGVNLERSIPWHWIGWGALVVLGALGLLWVWNRQLNWRVIQATRRLKEREGVFEAVAETSSAAIFIHKGGRLCYVNPATSHICGYSADELLNMNFWDIVSPESREMVKTRGQARLQGEKESERYDVPLLCKNGEMRWIDLGTHLIDHEGSRAVLGTFLDITERRNAEQALREREEKERAFAQMLSALHEVSLDLSMTKSQDDLCRMAVILGMERLGFERMGIWFLTQDPEVLIGSYGVDEQGKIRDERNTRRALNTTESIWREVVTGRVLSRVDPDTAQGDDLGNMVSRGWAAIAALRDRDQILGVVTVDTLLSGNPITEHMHQLLQLYAGNIAHLCRRRRDESALRDSEERYRTFFSSMSEGIYRYEARKPIPVSLPVDEQFAIIMESVYLAECNEAMARMHGFATPESLVGIGLKEFIEEDPRNINYAREFIKAGYRLEDFPSLINDAQGHQHHFVNSLVGFVEDGFLVRAWGVQRDVTERKRSEEALRERDDMIRSLVETSRDWIWAIDLHGVHTFSNPAVESILGYRPEEIVGKCSNELTHEEDRSVFEEQFPRWIAERRGWHNVMIRWRHKDGGWRYLESSAVPILDAKGNLTGYRGVDRDITDRRQLQEQLLQAQKMEAVGQLAGGIAHDFNNLLQAILGYTELILEDLKPGEKHREELEQVRLAAERASSLTRQLLTFSRRQVIQPVPVDLNEVVAGLMKMLCRLIGEHIQLDILPGYRLGTIHADVSQIEQVLLNLCVNARDAMPDGGRLTIETENVVIDNDFKANHPWAKEGRYVLLSVTDTGCGMDKNTLEHVFEPFFTTKGEGEGTGLGLATAYGIVKHHDGMIHTYSEVGKGTTFKIYLPISQRAAVVIGDKVAGTAPGGAETILLAEDEEMILNLAARILRDAGYTVLTASDGIEAMHVFEAHADSIQLALLDVVMPRLGGRDVQKRIHEKRPLVKFLFASGYSSNAIHTNFVLGEDMQLIQKPYQRDALLRKVREVLDSP